jgi:hypothetical protein
MTADSSPEQDAALVFLQSLVLVVGARLVFGPGVLVAVVLAATVVVSVAGAIEIAYDMNVAQASVGNPLVSVVATLAVAELPPQAAALFGFSLNESSQVYLDRFLSFGLAFSAAYLVEQFVLLSWGSSRRLLAFLSGFLVAVTVFTLRFCGYTALADGIVLALVLAYFWYVR